LSSMCRVLRIQRSGYYAWKAKPKSDRTVADEALLVTAYFGECDRSFRRS